MMLWYYTNALFAWIGWMGIDKLFERKRRVRTEPVTIKSLFYELLNLTTSLAT